jgi:hypothetical protein
VSYSTRDPSTIATAAMTTVDQPAVCACAALLLSSYFAPRLQLNAAPVDRSHEPSPSAVWLPSTAPVQSPLAYFSCVTFPSLHLIDTDVLPTQPCSMRIACEVSITPVCLEHEYRPSEGTPGREEGLELQTVEVPA